MLSVASLVPYANTAEYWKKLIHFWPMFPIYNPWKQQKTFSFLLISSVLKWEHWPEMN